MGLWLARLRGGVSGSTLIMYGYYVVSFFCHVSKTNALLKAYRCPSCGHFIRKAHDLEQQLTICKGRVEHSIPKKVYQLREALFGKLDSINILYSGDQKLYRNMEIAIIIVQLKTLVLLSLKRGIEKRELDELRKLYIQKIIVASLRCTDMIGGTCTREITLLNSICAKVFPKKCLSEEKDFRRYRIWKSIRLCSMWYWSTRESSRSFFQLYTHLQEE